MTPPLPIRPPSACGFDPERLADAERLVEAAVGRDGVPGAVLLVARHGAVAVRRAFGAAALRPETRPMLPDTVFDLASLTKCVATGMVCAQLIEQGRIGLDDPVARHLPVFAEAAATPGFAERGQVTVRHLLTHCAGVPAGGAYAGKKVTLAQVARDIAFSRKIAPPGTRFLYSDFSALALGAVVEAVERCTLDFVARDRIFTPLGMADTRYVPGPYLAPRCASTSAADDTSRNRGRVHDPIAAALDGVAGHAGLFSTADDLARLAQLLLNGGEYAGVRLLKPETVRLATTKQSPFAGDDRGMAWDIASGYAIRGELSADSFGHTGFTGTSLWIDRGSDLFVILLTAAVHAKPPTRAVIPLRRALSTAVARARI